MPYKQETGTRKGFCPEAPHSRGSVSAWTVAGAQGEAGGSLEGFEAYSGGNPNDTVTDLIRG